MTIAKDGHSGDNRTRAELWHAAIKVPMYTVSVIPVFAGSAAAYSDSGALHCPTLFAFLLAYVCCIAWLNLSNDVFDFDTGIDVRKKESVVNLCGGTRQARQKVFLVANAFLVVALLMFYALSVYSSFDPTAVVILCFALFGGYAYQGPPFRLGYYGLGEPICFVTWFMATVAIYYSHIRLDKRVMQEFIDNSSFSDSGTTITERSAIVTGLQLLAYRLSLWSQYHIAATALVVSWITATILFCSHFHQIVDDRNAGKTSPIVALGTARASQVLQFIVFGLYACHMAAWLSGALPGLCTAAVLLSLPHGIALASFVQTYHAAPDQVRFAKYYAVRLHFVHGMVLSGGLLAVGYIRSRGS